MLWADTSINPNVLGDRNFQTLSTKAQLLDKLNRSAEANEIMKEALPLGNMNQIHNYARELLKLNKIKEAAETFTFNANKYPNTYTTNMGMVRGLSAEKNFDKAIEYANKALKQAPDNANKNYIEDLIKKLKNKENINK